MLQCVWGGHSPHLCLSVQRMRNMSSNSLGTVPLEGQSGGAEPGEDPEHRI